MSKLQEKMAEFGFESNDDYQYHLKSFFSAEHGFIRVLNIEGEQQRRKTAFANALALSLEYPHHLYYDFSQQEPIEGKVILPDSKDEDGVQAPPVSDFDHIMSEACAFSEAEDTVLILDQLHLTDFQNHIRLYHFIQTQMWNYNNTELQANKNKLILFFISQEPLYHSLQKCSFRLWVNTVSDKHISYVPEDFDLSPQAKPFMQELSQLFIELGLSPTKSEYRHILHDIHFNIETEEHLIHSLYAWMEGINRDILLSKQIKHPLKKVMDEIHNYLIAEQVELD